LTRPELVSDPERVSPEWLTAVLRGAGEIADARVVEVSRQRVGTGQVGQNVRFSLAYDRPQAGARAAVVGKFPSPDATSRATARAQGIYAKEVRFYQAIAPTVGIRTPRVLFCDLDPATHDFVLLMEDLSPAVQGDQIEGCTAGQAALALDELAKLHAPRWDDPALLALDWISRPSADAGRLLQAFYQSVWPGFAARFGPRLSPEALGAAERLGKGLAAWVSSASGPLTVTHGDYRLDNMLFGTREGGYPLAVVDWQTSGLGHALADASYFLGAGLVPELRRAHERELLREYHAALRAGGVELGWERCFEDYRRFTWSGVVMAVVASMIVGQSERGDAMFVAMAERHALHALDWGAEAFLA
jgi:hypothetical protein